MGPAGVSSTAVVVSSPAQPVEASGQDGDDGEQAREHADDGRGGVYAPAEHPVRTGAAGSTMAGMTENPEIGTPVLADGIVTNYHVAGEGPPVVLIHGSGPGVSAWANWRLNIGPLSERNTVYAPDMVGFGFTERPAGIEYGLETWRDHFLGFVDALDLDTVQPGRQQLRRRARAADRDRRTRAGRQAGADGHRRRAVRDHRRAGPGVGLRAVLRDHARAARLLRLRPRRW